VGISANIVLNRLSTRRRRRRSALGREALVIPPASVAPAGARLGLPLAAHTPESTRQVVVALEVAVVAIVTRRCRAGVGGLRRWLRRGRGRERASTRGVIHGVRPPQHLHRCAAVRQDPAPPLSPARLEGLVLADDREARQVHRDNERHVAVLPATIDDCVAGHGGVRRVALRKGQGRRGAGWRGGACPARRPPTL